MSSNKYAGGKTVKNSINQLLNSVLYKNRHQKAISAFSKKKQDMLLMSDDEFDMKYIEITTKYEHKKMLLSVVAVVWITSILMNIWKYFFEIITKLISISMNSSDEEISKVSIYLVVSIAGILFLIGLVVLIVLLNDLYKLTKEKNFLERVKELRQEII